MSPRKTHTVVISTQHAESWKTVRSKKVVLRVRQTDSTASPTPKPSQSHSEGGVTSKTNVRGTSETSARGRWRRPVAATPSSTLQPSHQNIDDVTVLGYSTTPLDSHAVAHTSRVSSARR